MSSNEWKLPLNLAVCMHVLIALAVVYMPNLLTSKEKIEQTYTVNLINLSDIAPSKPAPAKEPPQPAKKSEPAPAPPKPIKQPQVKKVVEKAIALKEPTIVEPTPVAEPAPPAPPEAVSIKPSKHKVKPDLPPPPPPKKVEQDLSQLKRQKLAEMIRAEQMAAEEARAAEEAAELEKRIAEATRNRMSSVTAPSKSAESEPTQTEASEQRDSNQLSALENQYYAAIIARLQAFWSLPEYKDWDPALKATVVITVEKDGSIAGSFFESQSGDKIFDSFVTKALNDVGHLPPIPGAIKKNRMEIGLNFSPGGIR